MSTTSLEILLAAIRRRLLLVSGTCFSLWAILAALTALLVCVWLDLIWELAPALRIAALVLAGCLGGAVLLVRIATTLRGARASLLARRLDHVGESGGAILSGWELASQPARDPQSQEVSLTSGLAEMAVSHASRLAEAVPVVKVVPWRPVRYPLAMCGAMFSFVGLVALFLPALVTTEWFRFTQPFGDVPPFSRIEFLVEPGNAEVVYGGNLEVQVQVRGAPVDRVELMYETGAGQVEPLAMFPESGGHWRTSLARITEPATYFVRADRARSARYSIRVITVPRIGAVRFQITSPAYTNEKPFDGPMPQSGLAGLPGTRVKIWATSNRPLSRGIFQIAANGQSSEVLMNPSGEQEVTGEFEIRQSGRFELRVVDTDGQSSQDSFGGTITLLQDQRPFVRLIEPLQVSVATPTANVPVTISAEDDFGISRLSLFRSLNGSRPLPQEFSVPHPSPRRWQDRVYLPLSVYGVVAGDEIKVFARVEDNDPAAAKGSESSIATIHIVSQEDFERMQRQREGIEVLMSKYEQAQRRMENLAGELEKLSKKMQDLPAESEVPPELRKEMEQLEQQLRQVADDVEKSAEHLLPYDLDRNLTSQLHDLAKSLQSSAESLNKSLAAKPGSSGALREQLRELAERLAAGRKKLQEEAMEPLQHLASIFPLMEDESRFLQLAQRQRDLAERLASVKGRDGEDDPAFKARMRELEAEQRRLREELEELVADIENHATALPEDPNLDDLRESAREFAEAVRNSGAAEAMTEAESELADFSGTRGEERAKAAAAILESLIGKCNGMGGNCKGGLKFQPKLSNCLGNTVSQLLSEMGMAMGPGAGAGAGAGGGYSAQHSSLNNIGLYGGLPTLGASANSQGNGPSVDGVGAAGTLRRRNGKDEPILFDAAASGSASGIGPEMIPFQHRQRVGLYFQRVAEETETGK